MGTLTGTYTLPDGSPETGAVTFQLSARVIDATTPQVYTEGPSTAYLDAAGAFTIDLVPVDDEGFDDTADDLVYVVTEQVTSRPSRQYLIAPTGAGPWRIEELAWYDAPPHTYSTPVPGPTGPQGPQGEVSVNATVTGPQGSDALVEDLDPAPGRAVLRFTIPRGDTGPQGEQGIPGLAGGSSIYRYQWGSSSTASNPGAGNVSIQATGGQNRSIAISGTDADGVPRNWAPLQPGDNFTVTDDPETEPITGFARYTITGTVEVLGGGTWFRATALRTDTSGTQQPPSAGTPLRVAAALAGPSGLEPILKDDSLGRLSIAGIEMGDTESRDVRGLADPSWTVNVLLLRRIGNSVYLTMDLVAGAAASAGVFQLPLGFRAISGADTRIALRRNEVETQWGYISAANGLVVVASPRTENARMTALLTFPTDKDWPTTLPGTPPTSQLPV